MCSKNGVFRYFWGYVQGARNIFGSFLKFHHLALFFSFKMSYWTVTSDFFHKDTAISSFDIYPNNLMSIHIDSGAYHFAFENLSWKFVLAGFDGLWIRIYSQKIDISISKMVDSMSRIEIDRGHSIGIWNPAFGGFTVVKYFM